MQASVISLDQLSKNYWLLRVTKPESFNFIAGQHISLKVHPEDHRRTYSLSSQPNSPHLDLLADISPMGLGSKFILSLRPGDLIDFIGPMGKFVKASDGLFFAGGSGIAPYLSMQAQPILWFLRRKSDYFDTGLNPTVFYSRHKLTSYLKSHISNHIYICGSPSYVSGVSKLLLSIGVNPGNLHTEKFV